MEKRLVKLVRVYADNTAEYIDGEDLEAYENEIGTASVLALSHGFKGKKLKWKKTRL